MNHRIRNWIALATVGLLGSGCISTVITHSSTLQEDEPRAKVEFESDGAARLFYETLNNHCPAKNKSESMTRVKIPIIFTNERRVVSGPNRKFNAAVAACDLNKDGKITELEAKIYANQR
jgi:hypothetical protein